MKNDTLEDLNALNYPVKIEYDDEDALFIAGFPDLPGCSATGSTVPEAYEHALEAKGEWLRVTLEQGLPVPRPSKTRDYSGRILVRLPVSLHATLADSAGLNGVSLNQYIVHLLSAGMVGDQVSSKLEVMTGYLRRIDVREAAAFQGHVAGTGRAESSLWQSPPNQPIGALAAACQ
jgi:predicted RNase H-like HicB family nuclease